MSLSAEEQLLLELTNRARLDPAGEAARLAEASGGGGDTLSAGSGGSGSLPTGALGVVTYNARLQDAATGHSDWILANDRFSHTGQGGSSAGERMADAGYDFSGPSTWGENLALKGSSATLDVTAAVYTMHANLFHSDGHRANMLNANVREAGMAVEQGEYYGMDTAVATQNFARSGYERFVTGVVYDDRDGDAFYSVGEGTGGIRVASGQGATRSADAGGYSLSLGADGRKPLVTITADGTTYSVKVLDRSGNVKLDLVDGDTLLSSASIKLMGDSRNAEGIGAGDIKLKGRKGDNDLTGNSGDNKLIGRKGRDDLDGGAGDDLLKGGGGSDTLEGGAGDDVLKGSGGADTFVFRLGGDADTVRDFRQADSLALDDALWRGTLDAAAVIDRFAAVEGRDTVFDFGDGDVLTLNGVSDLDMLQDSLLII